MGNSFSVVFYNYLSLTDKLNFEQTKLEIRSTSDANTHRHYYSVWLVIASKL